MADRHYLSGVQLGCYAEYDVVASAATDDYGMFCHNV